MIFVVSKYLTPKKFSGITLFPFVILSHKKYKENSVVINHEKIHITQQAQMLVLPFYLWYLIEFLIRLFIHKNKKVAYKNISFEREAYKNEKDLNFLKKRPFWNFLNYL